MAYRLKKGRIGAKAVRRLGFEQIDRALAVLGSDTVSPEGVHECRKVVKRVRAVLRLFEPKIKAKTFKACYRGIGEAADLLAGARESHVLQETISKLETRFGPVEALPLAPLKVHLEKRAHEQPHVGRCGADGKAQGAFRGRETPALGAAIQGRADFRFWSPGSRGPTASPGKTTSGPSARRRTKTCTICARPCNGTGVSSRSWPPHGRSNSRFISRPAASSLKSSATTTTCRCCSSNSSPLSGRTSAMSRPSAPWRSGARTS